MADKIIIGVDTGNRCIKTANHVFVAGVKHSKNKMPFKQGILEWEDEFYMLSQQRVTYLYDKTTTKDYFAMTLIAIAKELETRKIQPSDYVIPITLAVGLPPSHLPLLKDKFKEYFKRGFVSFKYDNVDYLIDIQDVQVYSQGYAAIFNDFDQIKQFSKAYIIDIGGYTTDVISLNEGMIDPEFCHSLEGMGLIQFYNHATWAIQKKQRFSPSESQIDKMIETGIETSDKYPVLPIINAEMEEYISGLLGKLSEYGINLNYAKGVFIGGGSERFRKLIEASPDISTPYFISNVKANAQGYELISKTLDASGKEQ